MDPRPRGRPRKKPLGPRRKPGRPRCAPRDAAVAAGAITYEWVPCPTCGSTTRWTRNYNCILCRRRMQREADQRRRDRNRQAVEAELREWAERVGAGRIHEAVVGAIVGMGRPLPPKSRSGRRGPYRRKDAKPQGDLPS